MCSIFSKIIISKSSKHYFQAKSGKGKFINPNLLTLYWALIGKLLAHPALTVVMQNLF